MNIYPYKFEPILKERIWGGQNLKKIFNKALPVSSRIGESWELADLPEEKSVIHNGPLAKQILSTVITNHPVPILGFNKIPQPFPLLIKLLDAQDTLSVQVHPDHETCKNRGKGEPKTECWYVIQAEANAFIYKGLKKGVTKQIFDQALKQGNIETLLQKVYVKPGECHFLPAGTVHAIGAGLLIAEIQQPSNTTYRVFDFNRLGTDGNPRELHITDALESIHFNQDPSVLTVNSIGRLVNCEFFKIDKGHQASGSQVLFQAGQMRILLNISGNGILTGGFPEVPFNAGECILLPAALDIVMKPQCEMEYLIITI